MIRSYFRVHGVNVEKKLHRAFSIHSGYVNNTIIPTYHFQKSLMRLPIPELDKTMERYLASVEPVVTHEQFEKTKTAVADFKNGVGKELQQALIAKDKANLETSYINQWWFDMYIASRDPVVINVNPQIRIRDDPIPEKNSQAQRSAKLIASSINFFRTLRDLKLDPDIFHTKPEKTKTSIFNNFCSWIPERWSFYGAAALGAYPLDMSQYKNLFCSTRIPKLHKDELRTFPDSKHIVVQRGSSFYTIDVLKDDGTAVSEGKILQDIEFILSQPLNKENGVGLFTTLDRDTWAKERENLVSSNPINAESLNTIDSALFVVCLEHDNADTQAGLNRVFLHGDGSNHWFDKSFQLIVGPKGKASVNFEHSWGDGVAVLRYLNEMRQDSLQSGLIVAEKSTSLPRPLDWKLNETSKKTLNMASEKFKKITNRLLVEVAEVSNVDRDLCKRSNIGIDGVLQMVIQLAHYKLHGSFVSTYEAASTAAFKHGRTETVRSCTMKAVEFCKTMTNASSSKQDKEKALRDAVAYHGELTKNGLMGQGCDRHLFALKQMSFIVGKPLHDLFLIPSADIMNKIILSTSTLSSKHLEGGGFGPVNEDCYAVGYGMEEATLFQLSSYRSDLPQLKDSLVESLLETATVVSPQTTTTK